MLDLTTLPILTTERLILRDVRPDDAADVLVFRGDPYVQRFNSEPLKTLEETAAFIEEAHKQRATQSGIGWAITLRGQDRVLGGVGLGSWSQYHRRAEVGYDLAVRFGAKALAVKPCAQYCALALKS